MSVPAPGDTGFQMEGQGWEKPWRFVLLDTAGGRYPFLFAYALLILAFDESPKFLTRDPQTDMTVLWRQYTRPRAVRGFVEIRCGLACARDGRSGRQPAFSHGYHPEHTERLAAYWAEAFGGPPRYTEQYGDESSVVRMHSGNGLHEDMDRRAIACFDQALRHVGLGGHATLRQVLHGDFACSTRTTMARYHGSATDVPDGLHIPRWSWEGLLNP